MLNNISFNTFTTTVNNLWNAAKSYVNPMPEKIKHVEQDRPSEKPKTYRRIDFKRLLVLATLSLSNLNRNQAGLSFGLATLFVNSVNAALPTIANPIPIQYAQPGQNFSYDMDLNYIFNDPDGDIMTFGGVTMADGSPLPVWVNIELVMLGNYDTSGNAYDVDVQNNVAYVADSANGLVLINVTDPNNPMLLGNYAMPGLAYGVVVQNNIAYVADYTFGLQIINVSNPVNPILLGNYNTPGYSQGLTVDGEVAYVADYQAGLQVIKVSNPGNPILVGSYDTLGNAWGVAVQANIAYVADGNIGLQIINVTDSQTLRLLGTYVMSGNALGVTVRDDVVYVAADTSGLLIINSVNKANPVLLASVNTLGSVYDVTIRNRLAYVASGNAGLQLVNVSDPSNPKILSNIAMPGSAYSVVVQNNLAYVAVETLGIQILDLGRARLIVAPAFTITGNFRFNIYATNAQGEWIMTNFELQLSDSPSSMSSLPSSATIISNASLSPSDSGASATSSSVITSNNRDTTGETLVPTSSYDSSMVSSTNTSMSPSIQPIAFEVRVSPDPILIEEGVSTTLTTALLSISGNADPSQVTYSVLGNQLDTVFTVNGVEVTQFTQADVNNQFVAVTSLGTGCQDYPTEIQLQASVAGSTQQVDVSLIFQLASTSCNNVASRLLFSSARFSLGLFLNGLPSVGGIFQASAPDRTADGEAHIIFEQGQGAIVPRPRSVPVAAPAPLPLPLLPAPVNAPLLNQRRGIEPAAVPLMAPVSVTSVETTISTPSVSLSSTDVPSNPNTSVAPVPTVTTNNPSSPSASASAPQPSNSTIFNVVVSPTPILIEAGTSTLITSEYIAISGIANPSQVVFTVQGNNPDIVFTVNGTTTNLFTYADIQGGFAVLTIDGSYCGDTVQPEVTLQASVEGTTTQADVSLIFDVTSSNCNKVPRFADTSILNTALLLTAGIGFWAKGRDKKENEKLTQTDECSTAIQLKH